MHDVHGTPRHGILQNKTVMHDVQRIPRRGCVNALKRQVIFKKCSFQGFFKPIKWRYFLLVKQNKTVMHDVQRIPRRGCVNAFHGVDVSTH